MNTIAEIRRRHLVSRESISSIARDLGLSRPRVRKHCQTHREPVYRRQKQPTSMQGAFEQTLESWLTTERLLPKAQRRTARRLFEGLQAEVRWSRKIGQLVKLGSAQKENEPDDEHTGAIQRGFQSESCS
jgi:hypothetical protein